MTNNLVPVYLSEKAYMLVELERGHKRPIQIIQGALLLRKMMPKGGGGENLKDPYKIRFYFSVSCNTRIRDHTLKMIRNGIRIGKIETIFTQYN